MSQHSLDKLPNELILNVLEDLGTRDVVTISRLNRHLYALVQAYTPTLSHNIIARERHRLELDLQIFDLEGLTPDDALRRLAQRYPLPLQTWPIHPWRLTSSRFASWYTSRNTSILTYGEAVRLYIIMVSLNTQVLTVQHAVNELMPLGIMAEIDDAIFKVSSELPGDSVKSRRQLTEVCEYYLPSLCLKELRKVIYRIRANPIPYECYEDPSECRSGRYMIDFEASYRGTANLSRAFELPLLEVPVPPRYGTHSQRGWKILTTILLDRSTLDGTGKVDWQTAYLLRQGGLAAYFGEVIDAWDKIEKRLTCENRPSLRKAALLEEVCLC